MKKWFSLLLLSLLLISGCSKIRGLQYEKIIADHLIYDEALNSYFLVNAKPVVENEKIKEIGRAHV